MLHELRPAFRSLLRQRGFTTVVLLTLALGIGATTAIFSVVHHVLLRPLPYPDSAQLVRVWTIFPEVRSDSFPAAHQEFLDYQRDSTLLEGVGAYAYRTMVLTEAGEPLRLEAAWTTASLWPVLGVEAALGRTFIEGEDSEGNDQLALISHGLWQRRFGGDMSVVGRLLRLDGAERQIVGVMPPSFTFPDPEIEVWLPFALDASRRNNHHLFMLGRMRDGVTFEQVNEEMAVLAGRWQEQHEHFHQFRAESFTDEVLGPVRQPLSLLFAAVGFVLLIACVNVAGLLIARGEGRQRELGVRAALGAGRGQLIRQLMGESLLLALVGGVLGLLVAHLGLEALLALEPGDMPRSQGIGLDRTVLLFSLGVSLLVSLVFGLIPALRASRPKLTRVLSLSGGRTTAARQRLRRFLVVGETAVAVVLVVGALLLLRGFWQLQHRDPGFDPEGVLTAQLSLPMADYPEAHDTEAFYQQVAEGAAALPGVRSVSVSNALYNSIRLILVRTEEQTDDDDPAGVDVMMVSPDYFRTLGISLLDGRPFTADDRADAPRVAAVNQTLAAMLFDGRDAVGQRLDIQQATPREGDFEVVGLVGDSRTFGLGRELRPQVYIPLSQAVHNIRGGTRAITLALATDGDPLALAGPLRSEIWQLDDRLAVSNLRTMASVLSESLGRERFLATLLSVFAALALVLTAVGVYALLAYLVRSRRRELGIRLALGARPGQIREMVLGQGMGLVAAGLGLGLLAVVAGQPFLASFLGEAAAEHHGWSLALTPGVLLVAALLACIVPAGRAAAVEPTTALREE